MNTVQNIAKNTAVLFVSQILSYLLGFFATMYTARYLGATGFGIISLALSLTAIFNVFTDLGLNTLTVREVSRDQSLTNKYLVNTAAMKVIFSIITLIVVFLTVTVIGYPKEVCDVIYIIMISTIFTTFSGIFYSLFQTRGKMEYQSIATTLNSILMFAGVILAMRYGLNIMAFASIYLISNGIILIYIFIEFIRKFFLPTMDIDLCFWKSTISEAWPLSLSAIFGSISFRIDTVFLSIMSTELIVGWYSAAYKIMEVLMFITVVYTTAIYPVLSRYYVSSKDSLRFAYQKSFKYLVIIGLPIATGITLLADKIILLIYQTNFIPSIVILQILVWTIPLSFLTQLYGILFPSVNKQRVLLKIIFVSMLFNVITNLILIPKFSYIGASITTVLTELVLFMLCFHYISIFICKIEIQQVILKPLVACLIMGSFIFYVKTDLFLTTLIAIFIYVLSLMLLKTFSKDDLKVFRLLKRR